MISSIPILMIQRSLDENLQLMVLFQMIPSTDIDKFIKHRVIGRLLNRQYGPKVKNKEIFKVRVLETQNKYKSMTDKQTLTTEGVQDPVKKFVIKAIIDKTNWGQLIAKNGWGKLFVEKSSSWYCLYELWIIFICDRGLKEKEARFLIFNLTQRRKNKISRSISNRYIIYFETKLQKLLKKDVSQLQNIYYQIQRNLLISVKLKEPFSIKAKRLNLQQILQSPPNLSEINFNKWIQHLCAKFIDNQPPIRPNIYKQSLQWIPIRIQLQKYKQYSYYENKLQSILSQIIDLEASFTYQIELSLLKDLRQEHSWREARKHIQDIALRNGWNFIKTHEKEQIGVNPKIQYFQNIKTLSSLQSNQQQAKYKPIQEIYPAVLKNKEYQFKNQFSIKQQENQTKNCNIEQKSNKFMQILRCKIQKLKPKIHPLAKNLFQHRDQKFQKQYQQNSIKVKNEYPFQNARDSHIFSSFSKQIISIVPNQQNQQNTAYIQSEQNQQEEYHRKYFQPQEHEAKNNIFQTNNKSKLFLSTQQKLMLSLIAKAHDSLQQFKNKYFSNIPWEKLQKYLTKNKQMIDPIHRSILSLYRCNREQTNKISNKYIKKLTQTILNIELACEKKKSGNSKPQEKQILDFNKPNATKTFITNFDRLVSSIHEKQNSLKIKQQSINQHCFD